MKKMKTGIGGFTLVEVLVALTIFSGLMLTLFSSFNAFTAGSERIRQYRQGNLDLEPGLNTMMGDLVQIFLLQPPRSPGNDQLGKDQSDNDLKGFEFMAAQEYIDGHTFSRLAFSSLSPVQFNTLGNTPPGITRLTYYVHDHGERLDLHRADTPAFLPDREEDRVQPCADPVLFKDIKEFSLAFFDEKGEEHQDWDSGSEDFEFRPPVQVSISITLGESAGDRTITCRVPLPVKRVGNQ